MNDELRSGAIPRDKAEQVAAMIFEVIRRDLGQLHAEMVAIRSTGTGVQGELALLANKADLLHVQSEVSAARHAVQQLHSEMQAMEGRINARLRRAERRLLLRLGGLAVVLTGVLFAALRFLPLAVG
jgi:hypothetical protein